VIDHDRHRRLPECRRQLGDQVGFHVNLQMPSDGSEALCECNNVVDFGTLSEVRHVMKTGTAEAGSV
jgi:hypothetical protein